MANKSNCLLDKTQRWVYYIGMNNEQIATELKTLLGKFNRGVRKVEIDEFGVVRVSVAGSTTKALRRNAIGVITDMGLCGGFRDIRSAMDNINGGVIISAESKVKA